MMEVIEVMIPVFILVLCAYGIGYLSGSEATREIYNPVVRKNNETKWRILPSIGRNETSTQYQTTW